MTSDMYSDSQPTEHDERRRQTLAALWTPAAQERLTFLKSIPAGNRPTGITSEMGYLEGYKNAAERKGTN